MGQVSLVTSKNYQTSLKEIDELLRRSKQPVETYQKICTILRHSIPHYTWVGIYILEGNMLRLKAYDGPAATEHTEIELGKGICGAAAKSSNTEIVPDVSEDPRYLQCSTDTKSEIVVPIKISSQVYGEIDIDSDSKGAFTPADKGFLEKVATKLLPLVEELREKKIGRKGLALFPQEIDRGQGRKKNSEYRDWRYRSPTHNLQGSHHT